MKISIITASYNSAATIKDTLDSVRDQRNVDIEHLIIDGVSTDGTLDICREYPHLAKVSSKKDKGIYDAMNRGLDLCTGDIVGILNSDDFYTDKHVLEDVVKAFENTDVDAIYGDLVFVREDDTSSIIRLWRSGEQDARKWLNGWMPPHPTFFVRKEMYEKYGNFDLRLKSAADYELMLRFIYKEGIKVGYIPRVLVKMREGGQSTASLRNRLLANREDSLAWEINGLKKLPYTTILKPLRKINQFLISNNK